MVSETQARDIHSKVRVFFKGQIKSSNKAYEPSVNPSKASTRNPNAGVANAGLGVLRPAIGALPLDGQAAAVANLGAGRIGNCHEMALLACRYASQVPITGIWLGSIGDLGDHAFCLLGPTGSPTWTCALTMQRSTDRGEWVVDPWANVCCPVPDYYTTFREKMEAWSSAGKRIAFKGSWVDPASADYVIGLQVGRMSFQQF